MQGLQSNAAPAVQPSASLVFSSARVKLRSGEVHEWGRCRYRLEATPGGLVLTVVAMGPRGVEGYGDDSDGLFFCTMDVVESVELLPSKLQGAIS